MLTWSAALLLTLCQAQTGEPLHVFLRAGPKTHGEGEHDHPRFLQDWRELLTARGAVVDGALEFPSAEQLDASDVLVLYAAEGAAIHGAERERLERFLGRGGGLVVLHDALCGDDPQWFQTVAGGAWQHGRAQYLEGEMGLCFLDREHPITRGVANFDFDDEIYWDLELQPDVHVLASSFHTPFDIKPQMWTYEHGASRAFVAVQGHRTTSFAHPAWRTLLLRGIAWAGRRDADLLVTPEELAALAYPPGGPRAPAAAADALQLDPDFRMELVAAEPLIEKPISLDWDAKGRMWVALTPGYPDKASSGQPARDEVVILTDGNGDGSMDARQVFAGGLDLVTSLVPYGDGVIVTQAPQILWLRDHDGDDVADERVVLYSGFGFADTHAVISNLRWGIDGWIYGTQGYSGNDSRHVLDREGRDHGHIGNGIFRFEPEGSAIEQVVSYSSNTWGLDFTWDGELFFTMANGSHLRHVVTSDRELAAGRIGALESWKDVTDHDRVVPLRSHERPPYQQIDFVGGFTGASGSCLYDGGAWPAEYDGVHFVCEPTVNLVHLDRLHPDRVTFRATKTRTAEFLASTDLWFRPVHLRVGPEGALYLLDFYNQAAVHNDTRGPPHGPTNAALRPDRDHDHGRIWRIQHRAARPIDVFPLTGSERALSREITSPNRWRRMTAQRLLCELPLESNTLEFLIGVASNAARPAARVHALWILAQKDPARLAQIGAGLLTDPEASVRKNALRALATLPADALRKALVEHDLLIEERDPRAALAALSVLRVVATDADLPALVARMDAFPDGWSRSAVLAIAREHPAAFLRACFDSPKAAGTADVLTALAAGVARDGELERAVELVTVLGERAELQPELATDMLRALTALDASRAPAPSAALSGALVKLASSPSSALALSALPFCERWGNDGEVTRARMELAARIATLVDDAAQPAVLRLDGLAALLALPDRSGAAIEAADAFLDPALSPEEQLRAVELLGARTEPAAAEVLCRAWGRLSRPAREQIATRLLERPAWTAVLLDRVADGTLPVRELGPQTAHRLRHHPDEALARRAAEVLDRAGATANEDKQALLDQLAPKVEGAGDAARGRDVFLQNCANCHAFRGVDARGGVGPDLTGMGAHGARTLLPYLIDPNRSVEPAFVEYVARTTDGRLVDGVIVREGPDSIVLRSSSGETEIPRREIQELASTGRSPMPTGFESLGPDALRDLFAFLAGEWSGFRVLDLRPVVDASTARGLYDTKRDAKPMRLRERGVVAVERVPFELLDPERMDGQRDALVLRGGMAAGWESHGYPQRVEIPVGVALHRLHVLGGIAAWGFPFTDSRSPAVKLTWRYADGASEERVLVDGTEFADWIGRTDVPGSRWVDLLEADSWGQLRTFTVEPERPDAVVESIVLESFDNHLAPTFLALTAELGDGGATPARPAEPDRHVLPVPRGSQVLVFGGGSSHDFPRWFGKADVETLGSLGKVTAYSDSPPELVRALETLEVLVLATNQPLTDPELRTGLVRFVERGGGLVLVHASTWVNWPDWPEFNRDLVGGGSESHEDYGRILVQVRAPQHPVVRGVPESFEVDDELYRFRMDAAAKSEVLCIGRSRATTAKFPAVWVRSLGEGRIVGITLGHDGGAHENAAYRTLLRNAVQWVGGE